MALPLRRLEPDSRRTLEIVMRQNGRAVTPSAVSAIYSETADLLKAQNAIIAIRRVLYADFLKYSKEAVDKGEAQATLSSIQGSLELMSANYALFVYLGRFTD